MPPKVLSKSKEGKKNDNCPLCSKLVSDKDLALECEVCEMWFHIKCQNLSEAEYKFIGEHDSVHWYCTLCNKNVAPLLQMFGNLKQRQDKLEENFGMLHKDVDKVLIDIKELKEYTSNTDKKLEDLMKGNLADSIFQDVDKRIECMAKKLQTEIGHLSQDVRSVKDMHASTETKLEMAIEAKLVEGLTKSIESRVDDKVNCMQQEFEPKWSAVVAKQVDSKFVEVSGDLTKVKAVLGETKKMAEEEKDKESRTNNIIIYRVVESSGTREERQAHDKAFCIELFSNLDVKIKEDDLKSVFRVGKIVHDSNNRRPMLIQFRDRVLKNMIMESLSKLRQADDKFRNVSITHDMTQNERIECKNLVEEAKKKQIDEQGEFLWRVRGSPGQLKIVRLRKH